MEKTKKSIKFLGHPQLKNFIVKQDLQVMRKERRDTKCAHGRPHPSFKSSHKKAMLFPDGIEFKPASTLKDGEMERCTKYEKSLYRDQAILFGKDVIDLQKRKFKEFYHTSSKDIQADVLRLLAPPAKLGLGEQLKKSMK